MKTNLRVYDPVYFRIYKINYWYLLGIKYKHNFVFDNINPEVYHSWLLYSVPALMQKYPKEKKKEMDMAVECH